ncbi:MAG TPA: ABC transporter permease [Solirubrobacteraceae bacterium]
MTAISQTLASLRHRPLRTFLTSLGTALGIATIVALLAVAGGAQRSAGRFLDLGASDLGLFQSDAADPTTSILPISLVSRLRASPGIADATPLILLVQKMRASPGAIIFGADRHGFLSRRLVFTSGRMFYRANQIVIGDTLASQLHLKPGASVKVGHRRLLVTGTYHIGVAFQDTGAFIPLATAQAISGRQGETTTIAVKLSGGTRPAAARRIITHRFPGITVIADGQEAARAGASAELLSKAALVIAVLALLIGGIGVMNTMLMSVIERRTEFALLAAVGWSGPQIATRVVIEGVVTTVIGAALGLLLGTIGAHFLVRALGAQLFVSPDVTAWVLGRALLVGVLLGLLGGLYPAWRAARVSPAQVLAQR